MICHTTSARDTSLRLLADTIAAETGLVMETSEIPLDHPPILEHGDFASGIALSVAKKTGVRPIDLASRIADRINRRIADEHIPDIARAEAAAPGFVNLFLSPALFRRAIADAIKHPEKFGAGDALRGKKIMVEHTNPNLFKELHIGHVMNNATGESIARLISWAGATIVRANYQSDIGMNVAKTVWGMMHTETPAKTIGDIGRAYAQGATAYEEDAAAQEDILRINRDIYTGSTGEIARLYERGRDISLAHFASMYRILGTSYDHYFFESAVWRDGKQIAEDALARGIFEKSDGAIVFRGESYGLHTRVFVNTDGFATYEGKELGLTKKKWEIVPDLDESLVVAASEQNEYFKVVIKAIELIFPEYAGKIRHISYGLMSLAEGKMSSRKGNIVSGEALVARVREEIGKRTDTSAIPAEDKNALEEAVAVGAIKYAILRQAVGRNIVFDFQTSISMEGDSGPYLQYAHARACGILRKAAEAGISPTPALKDTPDPLERKIAQFELVAARAAREFAPSHIATYLIELASLYNSYYAANTIVDPKDPRSPDRVAQTHAFKTVLKNGLWLLGIAAPERM